MAPTGKRILGHSQEARKIVAELSALLGGIPRATPAPRPEQKTAERDRATGPPDEPVDQPKHR